MSLVEIPEASLLEALSQMYIYILGILSKAPHKISIVLLVQMQSARWVISQRALLLMI